ncbi:hypothetical protein [Longitalea arenae]|uniref:hypothetical protein n=1 Tax=Longitalea arenae TaxID=2812558 RepID=UPI0019678232|nr:hypothetical protein [Longitalea arenae]
MKTSNKLLLGIFLTIIILTTVIQVMVYAKYKRGEYVKFNRESFNQMTTVDIPAIRFVSVKGLGSFSVKPGDKYKLEVQKQKGSRVTYQVLNDTLIIMGDAGFAADQPEPGQRNYNPVNLYLPAVVPIRATYSSIRLGGSADSAGAPSYNIQLGKDTYVHVSDGKIFFNELTLNGEQSNIDLHDHITVNKLHMQLAGTRFDDKAATINDLTIMADDHSSLNISGKNLKALK